MTPACQPNAAPPSDVCQIVAGRGVLIVAQHLIGSFSQNLDVSDRKAPDMALLSAMWSLGQRGRHHRTIMSQILDLAVKSVPCRSSFVAEVQMIVLLGQPAHQLARGRRRVLELTQVAHFAATSAIATAFFAFEVSRPIKASPYPDMARPLYMEARLGLPPRPFLYMGDEPPHLFSGHTV